jgi:hypothetical protein
MYLQLPNQTPMLLTDRVSNLEATLNASENPGLFGTHFYAGGVVPDVLTAFGADTLGVAANLWVSELVIPKNTLLTGLSVLIGSVGGTDKIIVTLYDVNGNLLANSALAGTLVSTASLFQRLAFSAAYQAKPGKYYIGVMTSSTTAKIQTQVGGDHDAGVLTGQTVYAASMFTLTNPIVPPSTFTTGKGPVAMTY